MGPGPDFAFNPIRASGAPTCQVVLHLDTIVNSFTFATGTLA